MDITNIIPRTFKSPAFIAGAVVIGVLFVFFWNIVSKSSDE
jgi:hypothetical protein